MATVRRNFVFDDVRDADLLAMLDALPSGEKSTAARAGLRLYFEQSEPQLSDVLARIDSVQAAIDDLAKRGVAITAAGDGPAEETAEDDLDPDILDNLLSLGLD
jgi:hypothetical protein